MKTVWVQAHGGSNPSASAKFKGHPTRCPLNLAGEIAIGNSDEQGYDNKKQLYRNRNALEAWITVYASYFSASDIIQKGCYETQVFWQSFYDKLNRRYNFYIRICILSVYLASQNQHTVFTAEINALARNKILIRLTFQIFEYIMMKNTR